MLYTKWKRRLMCYIRVFFCLFVCLSLFCLFFFFFVFVRPHLSWRTCVLVNNRFRFVHTHTHTEKKKMSAKRIKTKITQKKQKRIYFFFFLFFVLVAIYFLMVQHCVGNRSISKKENEWRRQYPLLPLQQHRHSVYY